MLINCVKSTEHIHCDHLREYIFKSAQNSAQYLHLLPDRLATETCLSDQSLGYRAYGQWLLTPADSSSWDNSFLLHCSLYFQQQVVSPTG